MVNRACSQAAEYHLLPHLLVHGALCRVSHLLVEWHLNAEPSPRRLDALALRLGLRMLLERGCPVPPRIIEHEEPESTNLHVGVAGLAELSRAHETNGSDPSSTFYGSRWEQTHAAVRNVSAQSRRAHARLDPYPVSSYRYHEALGHGLQRTQQLAAEHSARGIYAYQQAVVLDWRRLTGSLWSWLGLG